jgi:hypothetical protein
METQPIEILPQLTLPMVTLQFPPLYVIAPAMVPPKYRHKPQRREALDYVPLDSIPLDEKDKEVVPLASEPLRLAMYRLEVAPAWAFDAWVQRIAEEQLCAEAISWGTTLLDIDRSCWNIQEKWRIINTLAEAGCTLPLFSREEAAVALLAMRESHCE